MANVSEVLNEIAAGLRGPLATSILDLIAERDAAEAQRVAAVNALAEEQGREATETEQESTAAQDARDAFGEVAGLFDDEELPDVEPLPEPTPEPEPQPEPTPEPEPQPEPAPSEPAADEPVAPAEPVDDGSGAIEPAAPADDAPADGGEAGDVPASEPGAAPTGDGSDVPEVPNPGADAEQQ